MRNALTIGLLLLVTALGCGPQPVPPSASEPQPSRTSPADESLTSEEYVQLGMPAHDRVWLGPDMAQAEKVLASVATMGKRLPRYQSARSGAVFQRMTAPQNLDSLRDRDIPISVRMQTASIYFQACNQIIKLYLGAFIKGEVGGSEAVELMGAHLRTSAVLLDLVDEFVPTLDRNDPTYPVRMRGLEGLRTGLAVMIAGCLQTLTERGGYQSDELVRLVGYMEETFPRLVPKLPAGSRAEVLIRLKTIHDDPTYGDLRPGLSRVHVGVVTALERNPPR